MRESFYYQIKERRDISDMELIREPEVIIEYLRKIVGVSGSYTIEKLIVREIRSSFGVESKEGERLNAVIDGARRRYLDR